MAGQWTGKSWKYPGSTRKESQRHAPGMMGTGRTGRTGPRSFNALTPRRPQAQRPTRTVPDDYRSLRVGPGEGGDTGDGAADGSGGGGGSGGEDTLIDRIASGRSWQQSHDYYQETSRAKAVYILEGCLSADRADDEPSPDQVIQHITELMIIIRSGEPVEPLVGLDGKAVSYLAVEMTATSFCELHDNK